MPEPTDIRDDAARPAAAAVAPADAAAPPRGAEAPRGAPAPRPFVERRFFWLLGALLVVGFAVRLVFVQYCRFTGDEAQFYGTAQSVVDDHWLPKVGPAVTGGEAKHPGGSFFVLMALPQLFSRSPLAGMVFVVLLNLGAYALLAAAVRRMAGPGVALAFAGLFVFSPWSYFYSDRVWNSDTVLLFTALVLWATARVLHEPKSRHVFWIPFCLVLLPQFHLSAPLLMGLVLLYAVVYRPRVRWAYLGLGTLAGALTYLPYVLDELRHGFRNTLALLAMPPDPAYVAGHYYRAPLQLLLFGTGEMGYFVNKGYWFPYSEAEFYGADGGLGQLVTFFGGGFGGMVLVVASAATVLVAVAAWLHWGATLIGAGRGAWARLKANPWQLGLLYALVATPLLLVFGRKAFHPHYINVLYPLAFAPLIAGLGWLLKRGLWRTTLVWVVVAACAQTVAAGFYYTKSEARLSYAEHRATVDYVLRTSGGRPFALTLALAGTRANAYPHEILARHELRKPFPLTPSAPLRYTVLDREAGERLMKQPQPRVAGRPVVEALVLDHVVVTRSGPR